ncbi:MAG: exported protein of unknown function [Candidatus Saccharibacteria bacterium]|nr:exported protein of unknown function [Candidatus Saccharibacteria bacterium]
MVHNKKSNAKGFTIVELLIVIVVIGILAAITIVSYNGITARANTSSAQAAANTAAKKAEAYNADGNNRYTIAGTELTGAASTTTYQLTGVSFSAASPFTTSNLPASPSVLNYWKCGSGTPANAAAIIAGNVVGNRFGYWNYQTNAVVFVDAGTVSGTGIVCFQA